jgi:hypothetical protein
MFKQCTHCGNTKPVEQFGRNRRTRDGISSYCFECARAAYKTWYAQNAEHKRNEASIYSAGHREQINERRRAVKHQREQS